MQNAMNRWLTQSLDTNLNKIQKQFRFYRANIYILNHVLYNLRQFALKIQHWAQRVLSKRPILKSNQPIRSKSALRKTVCRKYGKENMIRAENRKQQLNLSKDSIVRKSEGLKERKSLNVMAQPEIRRRAELITTKGKFIVPYYGQNACEGSMFDKARKSLVLNKSICETNPSIRRINEIESKKRMRRNRMERKIGKMQTNKSFEGYTRPITSSKQYSNLNTKIKAIN